MGKNFTKFKFIIINVPLYFTPYYLITQKHEPLKKMTYLLKKGNIYFKYIPARNNFILA